MWTRIAASFPSTTSRSRSPLPRARALVDGPLAQGGRERGRPAQGDRDQPRGAGRACGRDQRPGPRDHRHDRDQAGRPHGAGRQNGRGAGTGSGGAADADHAGRAGTARLLRRGVGPRVGSAPAAAMSDRLRRAAARGAADARALLGEPGAVGRLPLGDFGAGGTVEATARRMLHALRVPPALLDGAARLGGDGGRPARPGKRALRLLARGKKEPRSGDLAEADTGHGDPDVPRDRRAGRSGQPLHRPRATAPAAAPVARPWTPARARPRRAGRPSPGGPPPPGRCGRDHARRRIRRQRNAGGAAAAPVRFPCDRLRRLGPGRRRRGLGRRRRAGRPAAPRLAGIEELAAGGRRGRSRIRGRIRVCRSWPRRRRPTRSSGRATLSRRGSGCRCGRSATPTAGRAPASSER